MPSQQSRLPWWDEQEDAAAFRKGISEMSSKFKDSTYLARYIHDAAVLAVHSSNQHEGTLPKGFTEQQTYELLTDIWSGISDKDCQEPSSQTWHEEGGRNPSEARAQLLQHMKALKFITTLQGPLTVHAVKQTHAILMSGAISGSGSLLAQGYRQQGAYAATGHIYLSATHIEEAVADYVKSYNAAVAEEGSDPFEMAAKLFYGLVHLVHPFQNGNGRLGTLLVSYVLMAAGTPFPVPLVTGHQKPVKAYKQMISYYARYQHSERLQNFLLECCHYRWKDFATLVQEMHRLGH